jgi:hypothetical protein
VKSWADNAATPNLLAYIFAKDCSTMSTRLCFDGAWQRIAHDDARDLKLLKERCPQLIESVGPTYEYIEPEEPGYRRVVGLGAIHRSVKVTLSGFFLAGANNILRIRPDASLRSLPDSNPFMRRLLHAFDKDYNIRNIVLFHREDRAYWWMRVSFTTPSTRRWTFKVGDCFRRFDHTLYRILQVVVVIYNLRKYPFLVVNQLDDVLTPAGDILKDPLLNLQVYTPGRQEVLGLPALPPNKSYVIQASAMMEELIEPASEGQLFFLDCNWTLDFM